MLKSHYKDVFENQYRHWWYLGMGEINKTLLDNFLPKRSNLKILDAGCGPGAMLKILGTYGEVVGVDISNEALKYAGKIGKVMRADITKTKFEDGSFDLINCMDVLYHTWVKDEFSALKEFNRILKKGGYLLMREPAYNWMRGNEDRDSLTARRFSKERLVRILKANGFKIEKMSYANFFLFPIVFLVRIFSMLGFRRGSSDMTVPRPAVNRVLFSILKFEGVLMRYLSFPYGSSLICLAGKV